MGFTGNFLEISCFFLCTKKSQNRVTGSGVKIFKGVFVISNVNMCYRSQHSDHVSHPFTSRKTTLAALQRLAMSWGPGDRPWRWPQRYTSTSHSEYLVRIPVHSAFLEDLLVQATRCAVCIVQHVQCVIYKVCRVYCTRHAVCIVQGVQCVFYKVCCPYCTRCAVCLVQSVQCVFYTLTNKI